MRADIQKANTRLRRLEQTGLSEQSNVYNITVNALGRNRFVVPKSKSEESQARVILYNFLRSKETTVTGARKAYAKKRVEFETFLRSTVAQINEDVINFVEPWYMDYELKKLANQYAPSDMIIEMYDNLVDVGIDPTARNVERGLKMGLTNLFEYYITNMPEYKQAQAIGINFDLPFFNLDILVDIMYSQGVKGVISAIQEQSVLQRSDSNDSL